MWGLCGISLGGRSPGRADSAWGYRVDAGLDPGTGKRRQLWKQGCKNKREAETALNSVLKRLAEGSTRRSTMTVGNFLDDCLLVQKHRIRPTTWHGYEMRWSESSDISARRSARRCHLCRSRSSIRCCSSRCEQAGRFGSDSTPVAGDDVMHSVVVGLAARPTGLDCRSRIERVRSLRSPSERRTLRGCGARWPRSISTRPRWWLRSRADSLSVQGNEGEAPECSCHRDGPTGVVAGLWAERAVAVEVDLEPSDVTIAGRLTGQVSG